MEKSVGAYQIVTGGPSPDFAGCINAVNAEVTAALTQGWQPQGGVVITMNNGGYWVAQALVK